MSLIVVGTMAFDAIETPFGKIDKIVGGSATYVAYAASNFVKPVQQVSIVGNDFPKEEMDELKEAVSSGDTDKIEDEMGDVFFSLVNFARFLQVDAESALEKTNRKFIRRFTEMEQKALAEGKQLADMSLEEMDAIWNAIKKQTHGH